MGLKIDLGCGRRARDGYVGVDLNSKNDPEICADITRPIPGLADGCADEVICLHVLEHIPGDEFYNAMLEMRRLLRPGGTFEIRVPHPSSDCVMVQGHVHCYTPAWWNQMKADDWFKGTLVVDAVEEVFDERFLADREAIGDPPAPYLRYLRNVYFETCVKGHRP